MARVNQAKTDRAQVIDRVWKKLHYQLDITNCGNCDHADSYWVKERGTCKLLHDLPFPIIHRGVCKMHSLFVKK
jgi:hypothetical protein